MDEDDLQQKYDPITEALRELVGEMFNYLNRGGRYGEHVDFESEIRECTKAIREAIKQGNK